MVKKKFNNAYIQSRKTRFSSFTKRKSGLFSKARELSIVTRASILIICQSESQNFYWQACGPLQQPLEYISSVVIERNREPNSIIHGEKRGDEKTPGNLRNPLSVRQKRKLNKIRKEQDNAPSEGRTEDTSATSRYSTDSPEDALKENLQLGSIPHSINEQQFSHLNYDSNFSSEVEGGNYSIMNWDKNIKHFHYERRTDPTLPNNSSLQKDIMPMFSYSPTSQPTHSNNEINPLIPSTSPHTSKIISIPNNSSGISIDNEYGNRPISQIQNDTFVSTHPTAVKTHIDVPAFPGVSTIPDFDLSSTYSNHHLIPRLSQQDSVPASVVQSNHNSDNSILLENFENVNNEGLMFMNPYFLSHIAPFLGTGTPFGQMSIRPNPGRSPISHPNPVGQFVPYNTQNRNIDNFDQILTSQQTPLPEDSTNLTSETSDFMDPSNLQALISSESSDLSTLFIDKDSNEETHTS